MFSEKFRGPRRSFQMTIGLTEGYGTDIRHTPQEVLDAIGEWMKGNMEADRPTLTGGMRIDGPMLYGWNSEATGVQTNQEDSVIFMGEVNPLYSADLSDEQVVLLLKDLANFVGERFNQTRMYFTYREELLILQNDKTVHPTEKK
jgi:hypothetical protein